MAAAPRRLTQAVSGGADWATRPARNTVRGGGRTERLAALATLDERTGANPGSSGNWNRCRTDWEALRRAQQGTEPPASFAQHTALIEGLRRTSWRKSPTSPGLSRDSDIATAYAVRTAEAGPDLGRIPRPLAWAGSARRRRQNSPLQTVHPGCRLTPTCRRCAEAGRSPA